MAGLVPRLSGSAKMVAAPPADSHWSQVPAVSKRFFGVRDLAFFRRSPPQLGSETSGPADRKNSQSIRAFVLRGQNSVSTRRSAVQTEPDSRGLVPAIHAVAPPLRCRKRRILRIIVGSVASLAAWMTGTVLAHAGKSGRRVASAFIAAAFAQEDAASASAQWRRVADQLRPKLPKLAALMDEAEPDVLAYMTFRPPIATNCTRIQSSASTARSNGAPRSSASSPTRRRSPVSSARSSWNRTTNGQSSAPAT
jgi:hypothetical protein